MAYSSWLSPDKLSGNGNDTVNVSALSNNTGRNPRSTNVTFSAANCEDVVRTVVQAGKPETTTMQSTAAATQTGGTVTVTGTSNSSKLTFTLGTGDLALTLPASYTAAGITTNNGAAISGDPGSAQEFQFSIAFLVGENTSISAKSKQVIVTDNAGNTATCTLTQAADAAYLTVTPNSVEIPWDASESKSFTVQSNTNWTVS
jgi:hypothetical protein